MKKLFVSAAFISAMVLSSCGESVDACSCATTETEAKTAHDKAVKAADGDKKAIAAADTAKEEAMKACEAAKKEAGDKWECKDEKKDDKKGDKK